MKKRNNTFFLISLIMILSISSLVLTSCKEPESKKEEPKPTSISKVDEKKVLTARLDTGDELDPSKSQDDYGSTLISQIFDGLVTFKSDSMDIVPSLAEKWDISDDKKNYTFHLRKDVKFHDGSKFTADDVIFSYSRQMPPHVTDNMYFSNFVFGNIIKIKKIDDYTVSISLKTPYSPFITNMAMPIASSIISKTAYEKDPDNYFNKPTGTGPFVVTNYTKGKKIELKKNESYWGDKPNIDTLIIEFDTLDETTRVSDINDEKIDLTFITTKENHSKINTNSVNNYTAKTLATTYLSFNCAKGPFKDVETRKAFTQLIDKNTLSQKVSTFSSDIANTLLPVQMLGYNPSIKPLEQNIDKASQIFSKIPQSRFRIVNSGDRLSTASIYIAETLKRAGLDAVAYQTKDDDELFDIVTNGEFDIVLTKWKSDNGDPDNFMFLLESTEIESLMNFSIYKNPEIDNLLKEGRMTSDTEERSVIYQKIEEISAKEFPIMPINYESTNFLLSKKIRTPVFHPTGIILFKYFDIE